MLLIALLHPFLGYASTPSKTLSAASSSKPASQSKQDKTRRMSRAQAQNIAQALGDGIAPTPQNTPLQATPGGMR